MGDFDGIDKGTTSRLFVEHAPITAELLQHAADAILLMGPVAPCGSEERPHLTPPVGVGVATSCVSCGERVVYTSENRGINLRMARLLEPTVPRLVVLDAPDEFRFRSMGRYRYGNDVLTVPGRLSIRLDDDGPLLLPPSWRRPRIRNNGARSVRRTDFSAKGVPSPVLTSWPAKATP